MMNRILKTPILIIGFNRPETIRIVLEHVKKANPAKVYIAIDGPRINNLNDIKRVTAVKEIVKNINWDCKILYKFNEQNLGAELNVSSAISWVLENEESIIVLEDDIVASTAFFHFAEQMLNKYAKVENIYMVSGFQCTPTEFSDNEDYCFGLYGHTWGWATWRRAWKKFNLNVNDFDLILNSEIINEIAISRAEARYLKKLIKKMKANGPGNNPWDTSWFYIRLKEKGLSIIPKVNLISNIGIYGLHAAGKTKYHYLPYEENFIVKNHPKSVKRYDLYDEYHFRNYLLKNSYLYVKFYKNTKKLANKILNYIKNYFI